MKTSICRKVMSFCKGMSLTRKIKNFILRQ